MCWMHEMRLFLRYAVRFGDLETLKILAAAKLGRLDSQSRDDTGNSPLEIFNNPFERCVAEQGSEKLGAEQAFRAILERISGEPTTHPAHRIIELAEENDIYKSGTQAADLDIVLSSYCLSIEYIGKPESTTTNITNMKFP